MNFSVTDKTQFYTVLNHMMLVPEMDITADIKEAHEVSLQYDQAEKDGKWDLWETLVDKQDAIQNAAMQRIMDVMQDQSDKAKFIARNYWFHCVEKFMNPSYDPLKTVTTA